MAIVKFEIDTTTTPMDAVTEVLRILSGGNPAPAPVANELQKKAKKAAEVEAPAVPAPPAAEAATNTVTIEQVRAAVAEKRTSHRQEIKDILTKYGTESVTNLDPTKYAAVLTEIKAL